MARVIAVMVWLGLAWTIVAVMLGRWLGEAIAENESPWVPKDKPGGLCPHCEEPWLTWTGPQWAKCVRCLAFVHADMIKRCCREQTCRNLTPSYRALKQGMYCDFHAELVKVVERAKAS